MSADTKAIISDAEIELVHGNANFGRADKRQVVEDALFQYATGYTTGHTAMCILQEHGLLTKRRGTMHQSLTKKGQRYLRARLGGISLDEITRLRAEVKTLAGDKADAIHHFSELRHDAQGDVERLKARAEKAEAEVAKLKAMFRVNMLRLSPGTSHADIDKHIEQALAAKEGE